MGLPRGMILVLLSCFIAPGRSAHLSIERLAEKLQAVIDKHSSFWNASMSFAIHNDTMEVAVASGHNDYAHANSKITINDSIPMGSVTKMFTAVSVLRLAAKGEISLDQKVAPLIDRYLSHKMPCDDTPAFCNDTCWPIANCLGGSVEGGCADVKPETKATCSYCVRHLHCHCDDKTCPSALTLKMFWDATAMIENVTFRELLGMTSGVGDYYFDRTQWLMTQVLATTRDVEPLEFLAHMNKTFLFQPGTGRASYSTNGFSLVGLALAGHFKLTSWADLDQHELAWGNFSFADDQTLFPHRGPCSNDPRIAHQYASAGPNKTFFDLTPHSCLNSWMGGNLAARPLDVARFTQKVFTGQILDQDSLKQMTTLHEITDGFGVHSLAYGLGLEASWNGGNLEPLQICGMDVLGHGGEDYGSGAPLAGYMPKLKLGVNFAMASAPLLSASPMGMNCSVRYEVLERAPMMALNELLNTVMQDAVGIEPTCAASSWDIPTDCDDAPSFGRLNLAPMTCSTFMGLVTKSGTVTAGQICDGLLEPLTLYQMQHLWAPSAHVLYSPPSGYDVNTTKMISLCKGTCGAAGSGPCWLKGALSPWCGEGSSVSHSDKADPGSSLPTRFATPHDFLHLDLQTEQNLLI